MGPSLLRPSKRIPSRAPAAVSGLVFTIGLACMPALLAAPSLADYTTDSWRYCLTVGPSLLYPRLNGLNNALNVDGLDVIGQAYQASGAQPGSSPTGFPPLGFAPGAQLGLLYEMDEDMRIGLAVDFAQAGGTGSIGITDNLINYTGSTSFIPSSTEYTISETTSIPLWQVVVSFQRVFRFEEEPRIDVYLGGWGSFGTFNGRVSGTVTKWKTVAGREYWGKYDYTAAVTGTGWGAGGLLGAEYLFAERLKFFGESGFQYFLVEDVRRSGTAAGQVVTNSKLFNLKRKTVEVDMSGIFLRAGIRYSFSP